MAFDVEFYYETIIDLSCEWQEAFELLSDVPRSASHFPRLERVVELDDHAWRWEIVFGLGRVSVEAFYASRFIVDEAMRTVIWEPIDDPVSNGKVSGRWTVEPTTEGCRCRLTYKAKFDFPMPKIMKSAVKGLIRAEFIRMTNGYVKSLERVLSKA